MLNTSFKQNANKDKAVLYLRYSSESQTENSIEGQRRECGAYAKQKGIQVIGEYIDRAKTGMSDERPDFQRMIRDSFSKGFGNVIVWKSDRIARHFDERTDSSVFFVLIGPVCPLKAIF